MEGKEGQCEVNVTGPAAEDIVQEASQQAMAWSQRLGAARWASNHA